MSQSKRTNVKRTARPKKSTAPLVVFSLAGAALIIAGLLFAQQKPAPAPTENPASGSPALTVDKNQVDLGDVKLGTVVEASFELKNTGGQPLVFTEPPYIEVREGC